MYLFYLCIRMMFSKPNAEAFHAIALFLFAKLDQFRTTEVFRDCCFPVGIFTVPEFRKQCHLWLEDIANEDQSCLPKIAPSSLISPAGPKFVHLMYQFARHVLVEDIKRNSVGTDIPFAEAVKLAPKDMYVANARHRVAYNKLLQIFQNEDLVLQEYEEKEEHQNSEGPLEFSMIQASSVSENQQSRNLDFFKKSVVTVNFFPRLLIQEIEQITSEYSLLKVQSCKENQNDQNKNDKTERIQKVRSMWTHIMEVLTSLKKEREVVDYVLEGCVGRYVLDGDNVVFRLPQLLAYRVENDVHQHWSGNVYEAEKLNFLTVIQLLNEALRTLRDELFQSESTPQLTYVKDITVRYTEKLENLEERSLKSEERHYATRSGPISAEMENWEAKWKSFLGVSPLNLMFKKDSQLSSGALSPHPSNPAKEDDEDSIFSQHLVSVSDIYDSVYEVHHKKDDEALETPMDKLTTPSSCVSAVNLESSKASENRDVLIEESLHVETCEGEKTPVPSKILKNGKDESAISEMLENAGDHVIQTESPVKKEDPLKKARDELAEEVAKAVMSESSQSDEKNGMALEDLISSLAFNPFLTRKQIPRTPENLLTEIRSSWRKAIQAEGSSDIELAPAEVMAEEAPMDARTITQKTADSKCVCSPGSPVPDFDPPLSERKSQLSSTELGPQEQMRISHITDSAILETPGMQESERTEEQELKHMLRIFIQNLHSVEDPEEQSSQHVKKSMNTPDTSSENNSGRDVLPSDDFQGSLMDTMLSQNVSALLRSVAREAAHMRIFDETFPEPDNIGSANFASSESDSNVIDSTDVTDGSKNKGDVEKSKLDLQSLYNTHKALEKTASRSEEELHQTPNGDESVSRRLDLSLTPENRERDELCCSLEPFCLDDEFTKMPSPISLNERKYSLSSLLVSCQHLEEMASMIHKIPLDFIDKLKDKEQSNEEPGTKEPSSG
ncbi:HAUS augmin-like complex subunit 6 [Pluvialis apricaria]